MGYDKGQTKGMTNVPHPPGSYSTLISDEKAMAKVGIMAPSAPAPMRPPSAAGSSGMLRAATRLKGTCKGTHCDF